MLILNQRRNKLQIIMFTENHIGFLNIWLLDKAKFIPYGTDYSSIGKIEYEKINATEPYIICVDGGWRDRKTLIEGHEKN